MDDVPPAVYQPVDGEGEWAIVIDRGDAPFLRDLLQQAALDRLNKADKATQRAAQERNVRDHAIFQKYADRCERVRMGEARRFAELLGTMSSQD